MHLQLNEEQQFIQDTARRFSADELLPVRRTARSWRGPRVAVGQS